MRSRSGRFEIPGVRRLAISVFAAATGAFGMGSSATAAEVDSRQTFIDHCASCHGETARGVKDQGADLATSAFVKRQTDPELIDFIMMGRQPSSPDSSMRLLMPAFDYLTEEELAAVIRFIRNAR